MDLDDLTIIWFCVIGEGVHAILNGKRLRTSGTRPKLADSEVLTMEVIGHIWALSTIARSLPTSDATMGTSSPPSPTSTARLSSPQAANLQAIKDQLWVALGARANPA